MNEPVREVRGELQLVRRLAALLGGRAGSVKFGDDMCLIEPDQPLLWTVDMLMDGVDFDSRQHSWQSIGRKAMAVNLSDCAAMAALPVAGLCAVALNDRLGMEDAWELLRAAHEFGLAYGCPLVGGDTNSWSSPTVISISVAARCEPGREPVRRDGARPGDRIWLTGPVGGSILGRHMDFEPRLRIAQQIALHLHPHAMIDISDGLALDLWRLLDASGCGAVLEQEALDAAIHEDARRLSVQDGGSPREHALYDGEDFELIAIVPSDAPEETCRELGLLPLGRTVDQNGLLLEQADGRLVPITIRGWEHFR